MAGASSGKNVIEYVFQGNVLDLESATKTAKKLLNSTVKELKALQDGELNADQQARVKHLRSLVRTMEAQKKKSGEVTKEEQKKTLAAGRYVLTETQKMAREAQKAQQKANDQQVKDEQKTAQLTSTAGQEAARQRAAYLETYSRKFSHALSEEAQDDIANALAAYNKVANDSTADEEALAAATEELYNAYKAYAPILQTLNRSQMQASRGIRSFNDFVKETKRQIQITLKSYSFWIKMIKQVVQATAKFLTMLEDLRRSGQLRNPALKEWQEVANSFRALSRQMSILMTNVGGTVAKVLAPVAKTLAYILALVNALLGGLNGVDKIAENARSGIGLTNLDEINTQQEQPEDQLKKLTRGWKELEAQMAPVVALGRGLGKIFEIILAPIKLVWDILKAVWAFLEPIFGGVVEGLSMIVNAIAWVLGWVVKLFSWVGSLFGAFGNLADEGTVLHEVLRWIGIVLSGLVAIALTKYIVAAATSFATLAKNVALATAKLIKYIVQQTIAIGKSIASTIANWWENASLIAKIGLLTLGAGLVLVPIIMAATGTFTAKANEVPKMATGGVANRPTLAMIGEGKYPEAVLPLGNSPQYKDMKEGIAASVASRMGGTRSSGAGTPIILQLNGKEIARAILPDLGIARPQTGVKLV